MSDTCPICGATLSGDEPACPSCGFKLSGSTESFQPIDLDPAKTPVPEETPASPSKATLRIVRGPQIEMVFELDDKPSVVGRSPKCEIFLNDMTVSREHGIIEPSNGGYSVRDCESYNGIWINNENVSEAELHDGDIIQFGAFCLLYHI